MGYPINPKMMVFAYDAVSRLLEGTDCIPILTDEGQNVAVWDTVTERFLERLGVYLLFARYHNEFAQAAGLQGRVMADNQTRAELRTAGVIFPPEPETAPTAPEAGA